MPKGNRIVPPGGVLHIVNRGNDKKIIIPNLLTTQRFWFSCAKRVNDLAFSSTRIA